MVASGWLLESVAALLLENHLLGPVNCSPSSSEEAAGARGTPRGPSSGFPTQGCLPCTPGCFSGGGCTVPLSRDLQLLPQNPA